MQKTSFFRKSYIALILLFLFLPILCVVFYSFNDSKTVAIWGGFTLKWYAKMSSNRRLMESLVNSVIVAFGAGIISVILGTLGAILVDKIDRRLQVIFNGIMFVPLIIPEILLGVGLLIVFASVPGIKYGLFTIIVAHTTFCIPYIYLLVRIRLGSIEGSILEAARDLGATEVYTFKTIIFPLVLPAIISGFLLSVAMSLDDVIISFFLSGPKTVMLPINIFSMLKLGVTPEINALFTVILLFTFFVVGVTNFGVLKGNDGN